MRRHGLLARLAIAVAALALGHVSAARAAEGAAPRLVVTPSALSFSAPGDRRDVTLVNAGNDVLRIGGISIVSAAQRRSSDFAVEVLRVTELEPGATVSLAVTYQPPAGAVPEQSFAALVVEAEDPALPVDLDPRTGAPIARRLMGVPLRAGQTHALSLMILLPLLGAALLAFAPARRRRMLALVAAAAPLLLGAWVIARFDPTFSTADGNHGLQLVARATLNRALGFEYFVGVDGVSLLFVLLAPIVGVVAIAARGAAASEDQPRAQLAAALLVQAGATGVFVARDGLLLALCWIVATAGLALLAGRRTRGVSLPALASGALMLLAVVALRAHSIPTMLVDGTQVARTFELTRFVPDITLARAHAAAVSGGNPLVPTAAWGVLMVAFAVALPLFPFATPAAAVASPLLGLLWSGLFSEMALYVLARLGVGLAPLAEPVVWTILVALVAVSLLRAALLATREDGVAGLSARAAEARVSIAVLGLASLTPAGIAGALLLAFAHGVVSALVFALGPFEPSSTRGRLATIGALVASVGVPGLAAFTAAAIVVTDIVGRHPALAIVVLVAFAIITGAHVRVGARLLGAIDAQPAGVDRRALLLAVPLALIILALGLVPASALSAITLGVLDLVRSASI